MSCSAPISPATLIEYWLGELPAEAQTAVEEHFLGCAHCAAQLEGLVELAEGIRALGARGVTHLIATRALLDEWSAKGLKMREYRLAPGESVQCTVTPEDDLVISRLRAPLEDVTRLDMVRIGEQGDTRLPDIPFDAAAGEVFFCPPMPFLRALGSSTLRVRLLAVDDRGERPLGEYTFHHSPAGEPL
jgi:hypothetical protein